ncbi:beta-1,3-glucanase family protein [Sinomicrobium kalidii]|uniref:beta-1,3-glucanase family protein n=1 Tax=Sinomicrobium kalidii TaxID=2900738 RepID=UPI001E46A070|nr:beta-1,3-glucanase family protein [Sinomicrobium kalidii]UGU15743.1 beta-1,3-glucanase family protein [Sinomicrobium kalidii]
MKKTLFHIVIMLLLPCTFIWAQTSVPFTINNHSPYPDGELYIAIVGEDLATPSQHVWVNAANGTTLPMDPVYNTMQGPVIAGNAGPGGDGKYADCFTRLSDIPNRTVTIPPIQGCRVFIAIGSPLYLYFFGASGSQRGYASPSYTNPTDPNTGIKYEIIELTNDEYGFFGNPTRVDSYQYPLTMELYGSDGYYKKVGEQATHEEVLSAFPSGVPVEFQGCLDTEAGEIIAPGKIADFADGSVGTMPTPGPYVNYMKPYVDAVWAKYGNEDLIFDSGDAGIWQGRVQGEQLVMQAVSGGFEGRTAIITRRPTTQEVFEGKGVLDMAVQDGTTDKLVQAQLCAALNRHVIDVTTPNAGLQDWSDASEYYQQSPCNHYAKFWHQQGISIDRLSYGFPYDDVWDYSSSVHTPNPEKVVIGFGDNSDTEADNSQDWQLVWQDEFNGSIGPDWVFETGNGNSGWGNNELQYYRQQNASVQNDQLVITARRESVGGFNYTSARMKTQGLKSFKYGKIEARIALPSATGLWPAFWMLGNNITSVGWPACGEIDVMEHINTSPNIHGTMHWEDHNASYANYGGDTPADVTAYHVYSVEWDENYIRWFLDGQQYHEADISNGINGTHEFHENFFLLLNMAVGGNWPGFEVDNSAFPANMYVDYVRVYQRNGDGGGGNDGFSQHIEAENYSSMSGVQTETTTDSGGGLNVGYIETGDWMAYSSINIPASGNYTIEYRVASESGGGQLSLDLNAGATVLGTANIPSTGGWQNWTTISQTVYIDAGTHDFGIYAQSGGWNINWWRIVQQSTASALQKEGTEEPENSSILYPNPSSGVIQARFDAENARISIHDMTGRTVVPPRTVKPGEQIDVSRLGNGIYILRMDVNGVQHTKRFIRR